MEVRKDQGKYLPVEMDNHFNDSRISSDDFDNLINFIPELQKRLKQFYNKYRART